MDDKELFVVFRWHKDGRWHNHVIWQRHLLNDTLQGTTKGREILEGMRKLGSNMWLAWLDDEEAMGINDGVVEPQYPPRNAE